VTNHARRSRIPVLPEGFEPPSGALRAPGSKPPMASLPPPAGGTGGIGLIGQSVALHLADLLGPVLSDRLLRDGCLVCAARVKRAIKAWEVDVANAVAAAEPEPGKPDVGVSQSFTIGARGPVCWPCFDPDIDGPFDGTELHALLGDPVD